MKERKQPQEEEMVLSSLPEEIQVDIFLKLPVKSILACRSVCKVWRSLIGSHNFIKTHLDHAIRNPKLMLQSVCLKKFTGSMFHSIDYVTGDMSSISSTECACDGAIPIDYLIRDMLNDSLDIRILGSCNGLICMALDLFKDICIWNPSTGEYKKMQTPFCDPPLSLMQDEFGFCYDCISDEYKLVRISNKEGSDQVNVYMLGSKSWRRIQNPNRYMIFTSRINTIHFLNGALHWIGFNTINKMCSRVIISFDASTELFADILFPKEAQVSYMSGICECVGVLEDRLSLGIYYNQCIDVWVMQDYGVRESWSKQFRFSTANIQMSDLKFLWSFRNGELLIKNGCENLLYDPMNDKFKVLKFQGMDDIDMRSSVLLNYVESLVSPNSIK